MNRRFQQHQEVIWRGGGGVQDRTIYEDAVFAKTLVNQGLLDERDYNTYLQLFRHMSNFMCRPSVIIYLDLSPESAMERIKQRNRSVESGIPLDYLKELHAERAIHCGHFANSSCHPSRWEKCRSVEEMVDVIQREYFNKSFLRDAQWRPTS